jgi:hypothetical protein
MPGPPALGLGMATSGGTLVPGSDRLRLIVTPVRPVQSRRYLCAQDLLERGKDGSPGAKRKSDHILFVASVVLPDLGVHA